MRSNFLHCSNQARGLYYYFYGSLNIDLFGKGWKDLREIIFFLFVLITRCMILFIDINCMKKTSFSLCKVQSCRLSPPLTRLQWANLKTRLWVSEFRFGCLLLQQENVFYYVEQYMVSISLHFGPNKLRE